MNDVRLILFLIISSLIGLLGGFCITLLPLLFFMGVVGEGGDISTGSSFVFFVLFFIEFTIAGALTAIMMRTLVGSHIISITDGAIKYAGGSVIAGLVTSASLTIENFMGAIAIGILLTCAIGGTLCWLNMRANQRKLGSETMTTLNLDTRK